MWQMAEGGTRHEWVFFLPILRLGYMTQGLLGVTKALEQVGWF